MTPAVSRILLASLFLFVGALHFIIPQSFVDFMPPYLPWHLELVYVSGVFEILGGLGVLIPPLRPIARWGLIALLIAVFPANIQYTINAYNNEGWSPKTILSIVRLPLQPLLIWWVWKACR